MSFYYYYYFKYDDENRSTKISIIEHNITQNITQLRMLS